MAFVVGTLSAPITLDDSAFSAGLSSVNKAGKTAAEQVSKSFQDAGKKMTDVGKSLTTRVTVPLLGVGIAALKIGADFDKQMSKVAAVSGATGKDFDILRDKAREMGRGTQFSAQEAAEGLEYMALAGWDTNQMLGGIEPILNLATAGAIDLGHASDLVTDSMAAMGIEVKDLPAYLDKVAQASRKSNTDIDALMEAYVVAGGTFNRFNVPVEESAAMLGILANRGTKAGEAGTAVNAIMDRLTSGTGQASKALDELGISAFDSEGNFKGMEAVIYEVKGALEELTPEQQAHYQSMIAGLNHGKSFQKILDGLGDEYQDLKTDIIDSDGALKEMKDTMEDNLSGSLTGMTSALTDAGIAISDIAKGPVRDLVDWITSLVLKFIDMSDGTKQVIMIVAALAAAIGPLLLVGGLLASSIGALIPVFAALFSPITLIIGAIAALTAGIVYLWNTNETFREIVTSVWESIQEIMSTVIEFIVEFVKERLDMLKEFWNENGQAIMEGVQNAFNIISMIITTVMDVIWGIMQFIWPAIRALIVTTWEAIKGVIDGALNFIMGIVNVFAGLFTGDFSRMWDGIKQMFTGAVQFLWNAIQLYFVGRIIGVARSFIGLFRGLFSSMWNFIRNLFTTALNAIRSRVTNNFNMIRNIVSTVMNAVRGVISSITNSIRSTFSSAFNSLRGIVTGAFSAVRSAVSAGIRGALNVIKNMASNFFNAGRNIVTSIADGIKGAIGNITGAIGNVASTIRSFLPFSPAERGPLRDINKLDFEGPISDSVLNAMPKINTALNTALSVPEIQGSEKGPGGFGAFGFSERIIGLLEKIANSEQVIVLDTGELVGGTYPEFDRQGSTQMELTERWGR